MRSENKNLKYFILKSWLFFMFIISFDLIFEIIYGSNTLGFYNLMPGRLSGFFDQDLKIGNLYSRVANTIIARRQQQRSTTETTMGY